MDKDTFFKQYTFSGVDGSMPLAQRRAAMESDFILSTSLSMGTGVDVKNLACVVNFDQYSSPIITEQIFGRLRDRGKETWYFDITDHVKQARMFASWGRKRRSLMPYYPGAHNDIKQLPDIRC
jgi:superfamily II DNA or RNA helicase